MRPAHKPATGIDPADRPLDVLWQPRALLWVIGVGEALALLLALAPGVAGDRFAYFSMASLTVQWISLLTLGSLYAARRRLEPLRAPMVARVALGVMIGHTLLVVALISLVLGPGWLQGDNGWGAVALRMCAIAATVGVLALAAFQNHWRARRAAVRAKQAELEALQARVRPHFLFNTLNTAAALAHRSPEETEHLLVDLAELFRAALAGPREIALSDELDLVRRYLEIEALRFGERLRVDWDLPERLPRIDVPALSIQPLVENAIHHCVERVGGGGLIQIALDVGIDHVAVRVRNPLVLGNPRRTASHGVGLSAAQARVEALTGGRGCVTFGPEGEHYVATVRLPRPRPANRRD